MPLPAPDIGAPDERQHVNYVAKIYRGEPFPYLDPKDPQLAENYESHQPPAYYFLAANWMKISGSHAPDLSLPGDGAWLRALTTLFGAAGVLASFFIGLWGFRRLEVGLGAAAIFALLPMNVALSGAVSNDPLLFALCAWVLALVGKAMGDGWTWRLCLWIGALTGVALLTKTTALALVPVLVAAIFVRQQAKPAWQMVAGTAALAIAIALPWLLRNQSHYGDPFALAVFKESFGGSPQAGAMIEALGAQQYWIKMVWWWAARSFFGVFGYMDIFWPSSLYVGLTLLFVALAIGYVFYLRHRDDDEPVGFHVVNGVLILFVVLMFLSFNNQYFQAQSRYLFPALGSIAAIFAIGLAYYSKGFWKPAWIALTVLLLGLNLYTLSLLPDQFKARSAVQIAAVSNY